MIVVRVSSEEYEEELKRFCFVHAFNSAKFALLNNLWVDEIHFLLFKSKRTELAISFGVRNNEFLSPWSAPFGGFSVAKESISLETIDLALNALKDYSKRNRISKLEITMSPIIYSPIINTKLSYCLGRVAKSSVSDLTFYYDLTKNDLLQRKSKDYLKGLKKGLLNSFTLRKLDCFTDYKKCYDIIYDNHSTLNYKVKLTFEQLIHTSNIVKVDFFVLSIGDEDFAAAIRYWHSEDIVQGIYIGDIVEKRGNQGMRVLTYELQKYYQNLGVKVLDDGPSSLDGKPMYGLCLFKETNGCDPSLKNSYTIEINE